MRIAEQYQKLRRLKEEINQRLHKGSGFQDIKNLMLYLAKEESYSKLKQSDNQLARLDCFFNIWLEEKKKLSNLKIEKDIFHKISSLSDVEKKYLKIHYCGLRIENLVPDEYIKQALAWLEEENISGLAIGKIIVLESKKREENLLHITHYLRQQGNFLNALLLIEYANKTFPGNERLLLEEADIWLEGHQWKKALENLLKIEKPPQPIREMTAELQQVINNGQ